MRPSLVVTVDTEEEGLWGGTYRPTGNTVENIQCVPQFQSICDEYGIKPTYLVTAPVVTDAKAADVLRRIHDAGRCEVGAHLHPWCTPPIVQDEVHGSATFMCNLPPSEQCSKLEWLTAAIEQRFGRRPTSFRAGRYGLDTKGAEALVELGYGVDSSVIPFTDYSGEGGPDFRSAPSSPYRVGGKSLLMPQSDGPLLEIPVAVGFSRSNFASAHVLREKCQSPWFRRFHAEGALDRLGIARRIKFSPEQSSFGRMRQLVNATLAQKRQTTAMVMLLHSSSLMAGASPYSRTIRDRDALLDRFERIVRYCVRDLSFQSFTLTGCEHAIRSSAA